jgi:hypothetical protein
MTGRVQTLRSNVAGNRPAGRQPGELYVNWADAQLGSILAGGAPQDLIAVRFFSASANYVIGDFVIQGGQLYRAVNPSAAGVFNPANWAQIGGSVGLGDTPPATPQPGTLWWDSVGGQLYVWYVDANTSQWVIATNTANFPSITVGVIPPLAPTVGALWWDSNGAQLYIWYSDGTSSQWVPSVNQLGGNFQPLTGVTDGSDAGAGNVGEVISTVVPSPGITLTGSTVTNAMSLPIPPGDWDVQADVWFAIGGGATSIQANISPTSAGIPTAPSVGSSRNVAYATYPAAAQPLLPLGPCRASSAGGTTMYIVCSAGGQTGASATVFGRIWGRRVR